MSKKIIAMGLLALLNLSTYAEYALPNHVGCLLIVENPQTGEQINIKSLGRTEKECFDSAIDYCTGTEEYEGHSLPLDTCLEGKRYTRK